jgi:alkylhydroperoxidase/carboxymuconolactone decarboxylase family protein YurZ
MTLTENETVNTLGPVLTIEDVRGEVETLLAGSEEGQPLDPLTADFVELAIRATPTVLDGPGLTAAAEAALDAGATPQQIHEAIVFVAGIGLHTMIEGTRRLNAILAERQDPLLSEPLDPGRQALLDEHVGDRMGAFEDAVPGFFDGLVRISPTAFEGFFAYRSLPWLEPTIDPLTKELMAIAVDAVPSHRFLPTLRLHVLKALELGAGSAAILATLDLAAAAPSHPGVR